MRGVRTRVTELFRVFAPRGEEDSILYFGKFFTYSCNLNGN